MLSARRSLNALAHVTLEFSPVNSIDHVNLRLWIPRGIRNYGARSQLKIDEKGNVKICLDPRIEALQDKLIYCDYIEKKRLKYGYKINKVIERSFKAKMNVVKIQDQMKNPPCSVALKYFRKEEEKNEEVVEAEAEENDEAPIHMPYASTDQYSLQETPEVNVNEKSFMPDLNPDYKSLYESYIKASTETDISPRLRRRLKDLQGLVHAMEMKLPDKNEFTRLADSPENVPANWMTDYEQYNDPEEVDMWESNYGTSDSSAPISRIPCGGCGALLHCQNAALPGYLPSELFKGLKDDDLKNTVCQRCHFMENYNVTLEVTVSPNVYPQILQKIGLKQRKAAVILMIDLTDFPCSIWPNLPSIIGKYTPIFIVGNKIDLLPKDSSRFLERIRDSLLSEIKKSGIQQINIKHVELISAKTGFGVERLINKLHKIWAYKGDVYMVGCTNVGKSSLFNSLLQSDYCKVQAVDLIRRATTSPWPGTTLNLLKFPILNPVRWRLAMRAKRVNAERLEEHAELQFRKLQLISMRDVSYATLQERIGRTFSARTYTHPAAVAAYERRKASGRQFGINENAPEFRFSRWCYDTPGVIHPDQVLHLLTTEELVLTLPKKIISPRSFIFKPGQTLFLAGLGRLDLLTGPEFIRVTVFASDSLPITICWTKEADELYNELLSTEALAVPVNNPERLKVWPRLESKDFATKGIDEAESVCDILLSSAGWISITPEEGAEVTLRAWTPEGRGLHQRTPALLSKSITHRGARVKSSAAYRIGRQVYTSK